MISREKKECPLLAGFSLVELIVVVVVVGILASLAAVNYSASKRKAEYDTAVALARNIAAAEKNYFLAMGVYASTTGTANTNTVLEGVTLPPDDQYFRNYRVNTGGGTFSVLVDGGACTYTFNSDGVRTSASGTGCLP